MSATAEQIERMRRDGGMWCKVWPKGDRKIRLRWYWLRSTARGERHE